MMQAARLASRLHREVQMLQKDPPPGVCAWPCNDSLSHLEAQIQGPNETVYAKGIFKLEVRVPERYPFEPPNVRFRTPVYHPNIDSGGRICLDILNMPPKGAWKPSLNIPAVLASIGLLLAEPNPDDGLMGDITEEFKHDRTSFDCKAKQWTQQYAVQKQSEDPAQGEAWEQEFSATEAIEATPPATGGNFSFDLGFLEESKQGTSREMVQRSTEKQVIATCIVGNTPSPIGSNHKLNLSMKLPRNKGGKVFDRTIGTVMAELSVENHKQPLACIDNTHATGPGTVQQEKDKSSLSSSSIDVALRKGTAIGLQKLPHASGSTVAAAGTTQNKAITTGSLLSAENSPRLTYIVEGVAKRQIPLRLNKSSVHLSNFKRPRESNAITTPMHIAQKVNLQSPCIDEIQVSAAATSPINASIDTNAVTVDKAISVSKSGGSKPLSSYCSPKLSRVKVVSGRADQEDHSRETAKRARGNDGSTIPSVSSEILPQKAMDIGSIQDSQNLYSNPSKLERNDSSKEIRKQSEVHTGIPQQEVRGCASMKEAHKLTSKAISAQLEVENLSRQTAKGSRGKESSNRVPAESSDILNEKVVCLDHDQEAQNLPAKLPGDKPSMKLSSEVLDSLSREMTERSRESGRSTVASAGPTEILKQKGLIVDSVHVGKAHSSLSNKTLPTDNLKKGGILDESDILPGSICRPPKVLVKENVKAVSAPLEVEKPSTGVFRTDSLKKMQEVNPTGLIVLDSESDEEPPKGRFRLSLSRRKAVKWK